MCKWLDKRVYGFQQTGREFFSSKANRLALLTLGLTAYSFYTGQIGPEAAAGAAYGAIQTLFLKDAIVKSGPAAKEGA